MPLFFLKNQNIHLENLFDERTIDTTKWIQVQLFSICCIRKTCSGGWCHENRRNRRKLRLISIYKPTESLILVTLHMYYQMQNLHGCNTLKILKKMGWEFKGILDLQVTITTFDTLHVGTYFKSHEWIKKQNVFSTSNRTAVLFGVFYRIYTQQKFTHVTRLYKKIQN